MNNQNDTDTEVEKNMIEAFADGELPAAEAARAFDRIMASPEAFDYLCELFRQREQLAYWWREIKKEH